MSWVTRRASIYQSSCRKHAIDPQLRTFFPFDTLIVVMATNEKMHYVIHSEPTYHNKILKPVGGIFANALVFACA
jgi:hypothetical protein